MIELIEKYLIGKHPDQTLCEDGIFINQHFAAVIDGVTSKSRQKRNRLTSGCHAKEIILNELQQMPYDISPKGFFETLDHALFTACNYKIPDNDICDWLRACVIVYSDFYKQIWSVGDCKCMINDQLISSEKEIDTLLSKLRSFVIYHHLKYGNVEQDISTTDIGRDAIIPFLKMQLAFENDYNTPWGYSVLNGHGFDMHGCKIYNVKSGDTIILASDGYPVLCDTLVSSEHELALMLNEDPLCYKTFYSTKGIVPENNSFDDRAYIKFFIK